MKTVRLINWMMVLVGVWVTMAPFALRFDDVSRALWNGLTIGTVVILLSAVAALGVNEESVKSIDWINAVLGLWLVLAPFVLGYTEEVIALWTSICAGVVLLILAVWTEVEFPKLMDRA